MCRFIVFLFLVNVQLNFGSTDRYLTVVLCYLTSEKWFQKGEKTLSKSRQIGGFEPQPTLTTNAKSQPAWGPTPRPASVYAGHRPWEVWAGWDQLGTQFSFGDRSKTFHSKTRWCSGSPGFSHVNGGMNVLRFSICLLQIARGLQCHNVQRKNNANSLWIAIFGKHA